MSAHVRRRWKGRDALPGLIDAAEAVERTLSSPGWRILSEILADERESIDRELDLGAPLETAAEYAQTLGRRGGLRLIDEAARAIIESAASRRTAAENQEAAAGAAAGG